MKFNRMHILAGLGMGLGLLLSGGPAAHAEGIDAFATPQNPISSGRYHVVINRTSANMFSVLVEGEPSGTADKHSVGQISIGFLGAGGLLTPLSGTGGTTTGGGFVGSGWTPSVVSNTQRFNAPSERNDVAPFGGNQFRGTVTLASTAEVTRFRVALQNGTQQWFLDQPASSTVIPEPASLALVLPGLAPLGFMLLRRRSLRNGTPEAEETAPQET